MLNFFKKIQIKKQVEYLKELRPLPMGRKEFEAWSDEILRLAEVPGLTTESGKFALSEMILHVKQNQSMESFGHFVQCLRRGAANQVGHTIFCELKHAQAQREAANKPKEVLPKLVTQSEQKVLADAKVQSPTN